MNHLMFISIAIGYLTGGFAALRFHLWLTSKIGPTNSKLKMFSNIGMLIILLPAFFITFILGGNFGGSLGSTLSPNDSSYALLIGFIIGIFTVFAALISIGSALGVLVFRIVSKRKV